MPRPDPRSTTWQSCSPVDRSSHGFTRADVPSGRMAPLVMTDWSETDRVGGGYVGSGSPRAGFGRVAEGSAAAVDTPILASPNALSDPAVLVLPNPAALRTRWTGCHRRTTNQSGNRRPPRHSRGQVRSPARRSQRSDRPMLRRLHPPAHLASSAQVNRPDAFTSLARRDVGRQRARRRS